MSGHPFLRRAAKWLAVATGLLLGLAGLGMGYVWYEFPYGASHCCDLALYQALEQYAQAHGGAFPTGEATPEASLGLLYGQSQWIGANLLRGKTIPESRVQEVLDRGERLGPESCGWHYVENLRFDDDPRLGLFWDKVGLSHNGQRLAGGGHIVMFVNGQRKHVSAAEWPAFTAEQAELLARKSDAAEMRADAVSQAGDTEISVQLRIVDGILTGRAWWRSPGGTNSTESTIAYVDRIPEADAAVVDMPVIRTADFRKVQIVKFGEFGQVRFRMGEKEVLFDGRDFQVK